MCPTALHLSGSLSSQMFLCCLQMWLNLIPDVPLPFTCVALIIIGITLLLTGIVLPCFRCATTTHWGDSVVLCLTAVHWRGLMSPQVSLCHLLVLLHVIPLFSLPLTCVALIILGIQLLLTEVAAPCFRYQPVTHWSGSASFFVFQWCSLWWLQVVKSVTLHLSGSVSFHLPYFLSLRCLCVVAGVSLLLTVVAPCNHKCQVPLIVVSSCHFRCPTAAHWGEFSLIKVFHSGFLGWLCVISCVSLPLTVVTLCHTDDSLLSICVAPFHFRCLTATQWMALYHPKYFTSTHWCGSVLSQIFHHFFLGFLYIFLFVPVLLPGVVSCHYKCPTSAHLGHSASTQSSHLSSLEWLNVIRDILLPPTRMILHHFRFSLPLSLVPMHCFRCTNSHWSNSASSQVSQYCSLGWLCFVPYILLTLLGWLFWLPVFSLSLRWLCVPQVFLG